MRLDAIKYELQKLFQIEKKKIKLGRLKPHLHDNHFGSGTPKNGHAGRYFWHSPPDFLPCKLLFLWHTVRKNQVGLDHLGRWSWPP